MFKIKLFYDTFYIRSSVIYHGNLFFWYRLYRYLVTDVKEILYIIRTKYFVYKMMWSVDMSRNMSKICLFAISLLVLLLVSIPFFL